MAWLCILIVLLGAGCGQTPAIQHGPVSANVCDRDQPPGAETPSGSLACPHASEPTPATKQGFVSRNGGTIAAIVTFVSRRTTNSRLIVSALAVAATLVSAPAADAVERTATPATLPSVFASAQGGDTILLASGDYGTFHGGMKPSPVTLTPQSGATVNMDIDFNPASNIVIDGVRISDALITGNATKSITIRNSDFPGQIWLDTRELVDSNVTLANDVFHDWDTCSSCGEARVFLTGGSQPSGVTIRDSKFYGGLSDGIQNGSYGTQIIGNEFYGITPGSPSGVHADAIQLYGSSHTVIRGNYMHDMPEVPFIMAADGTDHELIEDNVVEGSSHGYPYITLFSDNSSIVRHNTFADGACAFNIRCGVLRLGNKDSDDPGHGTIVKDNILGEISTRARPRWASARTTCSPTTAPRAGRDPGQAHLRRRRDADELRRLQAELGLARQGQGERRSRHRGADRDPTPPRVRAGRCRRERQLRPGQAQGQEGQDEAAQGQAPGAPRRRAQADRQGEEEAAQGEEEAASREEGQAPRLLTAGCAGRASGPGGPRGRGRCEYAGTAVPREPVASWGGDRSSGVRLASDDDGRSGRRARPPCTRARRARPRRRSP